MVQPDSLLTMKTYLIRLNNEQCAAKAAKDQKDASTITAPTKEIKTFKCVTFESSNPQPATHPSTPLSGTNRRPATDSQHQADGQAGNCYICHQPEHLANDCTQRATPATPFQYDGSVSKLHIGHEDSGSESENE